MIKYIKSIAISKEDIIIMIVLTYGIFSMSYDFFNLLEKLIYIIIDYVN
jgi:hypothetical protein